MIDADLFDEFVKSAKRGRRLDRAGLDPRVVAELDRYLSRGRAAVAAASKALPTLPPIYADFVTNPQFNAFAFKHRDRYFIAFHDGLPLVLLTVLYRLLADRRVFRHVGEPDQEAESLPPFQLVFPDAAQLVTANLGAVVPKHARRQVYAIHLSHLAFDFLSVHEIAHLAHGHVDYLRAECGLPYVSELEWLPNTPEGNLELPAMELDADSSAARMIVHTARTNVAQRDTLPADIAGLYWEPVQAMFDIAVAVCVNRACERTHFDASHASQNPEVRGRAPLFQSRGAVGCPRLSVSGLRANISGMSLRVCGDPFDTRPAEMSEKLQRLGRF